MERQDKKIQSNWHDILLGTRHNTKTIYPHILAGRKEKPGGFCHKKTPYMAPQKYVTKIFVTNKKNIERLKDQETGRGCARTTNPGVTQKRDNPHKWIRNPFPWKLDIYIKGICNLVPNGTWNQWPIGLDVQTKIGINLSNQPLISPCFTTPAYYS